MRLVICSRYPVFAESMSFLLTSRGDDVIAVVSQLSEASLAVSEHDVDVCLVDGPLLDDADSADVLLMGIVKPNTALVLLTDERGAGAGIAEALGARAVADKRKPLEEIIRLIDSVHTGDSCWQHFDSPVRPTPPHGQDNQRLASFLTPREREVLSALVRGEDTTKLARRLGISRTTVRCHVQSVLTKMGAHSRLEVATTAVRTGVVSPRTGEWLGAADS